MRDELQPEVPEIQGLSFMHQNSKFDTFGFESVPLSFSETWDAKIGLKWSSELKTKLSFVLRSRWIARLGIDIIGRFMCTSEFEIFPSSAWTIWKEKTICQHLILDPNLEQHATSKSKISVEPCAPQTASIRHHANLGKVGRTQFRIWLHLKTSLK